MSLLLDALKRAEKAKLAKQAGEVKDESSSTATLQPTPTPQSTATATAAQQTATPLATQVALVLASEEETPPSSPARAAEDQGQRDTAKNVFSAKRPQTGQRHKWILPAAAFALLAISAGGWYVWYEINRLGSPALANRVATPPPQSAPMPITQTAPLPIPLPKPDTAQLPPASAPTPGGTPPPAVAIRGAIALPERLAMVKPAAPQSDRDGFINSLTAPPAANSSPVVLKLSKAIDPPRVSTELASAYEALKSGDYAKAKSFYAAVLQSDALNLDAHLGIATALARAGEAAVAARAYRKALEIDPRNGTALAGLLAVSSSTPSGALEVDLKTLLGNNPNSAALSFTLGNLYAAQSRWTEAQQVYFEAFRIEPDNADYIYNLAVSLDQLKQSKIALDYYQRALTAASKAGAQFDPAQVRRRVNELRLN